MIIESDHINCLTSHPEFNKKLKERKSVNILSREEQDFTSQAEFFKSMKRSRELR